MKYVGIGIGPGMGFSTAEKFAKEGYDVVITGRDQAKLDKLATELKKVSRGKVEVSNLDPKNLADLEKFVSAQGESVSVLHYNAASMHNKSLFDSSADSLNEDMQVDITAPLVAIKSIAPHMMKNKKGSILLTGGGFALYPNFEYLTLSIGKAGIRSMTEALFPELAKSGIHIATLTVLKIVNAASEDSKAAAEAFWQLHNQPKESWTWESVLK